MEASSTLELNHSRKLGQKLVRTLFFSCPWVVRDYVVKTPLERADKKGSRCASLSGQAVVYTVLHSYKFILGTYYQFLPQTVNDSHSRCVSNREEAFPIVEQDFFYFMSVL